MARLTSISLILIVAFTSLAATNSCVAQGCVILDEQPNTRLTQIANAEFLGSSGFDTYVLNNVVEDNLFSIYSVSVYYTNTNETWENGVTEGVLNIFDGDPLTAADDPLTGGDFGLVVDLQVFPIGNNILEVKCELGSPIILDGQSFWIGLTPTVDVDSLGMELMYASDITFGDGSYFRNPGG